jgi:hypothetical protein
MPVEEKRRIGVTGRAGVSVVRADRELAYGWYCLGEKRKENYDDWWRCEIRFEPLLDELFGVTHSKQDVTPSPELEAIISPSLEGIARTLNQRVRRIFTSGKVNGSSRAELVASDRDRALPPVPRSKQRNCTSGTETEPGRTTRRYSGLTYRIEVAPIRGAEPYHVSVRSDFVRVTVNANHPFHTELYEPTLSSKDERARFKLECLLLSAVRADLYLRASIGHNAVEARVRAWGDALAAFLDNR